MSPLLPVLRLLRPYAGSLAQATAARVVLLLLALPGPYLTKLLVDEVFPQRDHGLLAFLLGAGAAVSLAAGLVQALGTHFGQLVGASMGADLQGRFFRHLQALDLRFHDRQQTGEVLSRFDDMHAAVGSTIGMADTLAASLLQLAIFPAVLLCLDWRLALVSLAVLPLDAGLMSLAGRASRRFAQQMAEEAARVTAGSYEALANIRTIQALQVEAAFDRRMSGLLGGVAAVRARASLVTSGTGFLAASFRTAGGLVYGWVGWCRVLEGDLSIGTFLAFSGYVGYLYGPLDGLIGLWPELQATLVRARRFAEVYQRQPRIAERPELPVLSGVRGEIAFCGVSFRYGDTPVLRRVDLRIAAGSTVALVGRSGAGKSTLAKLIPRFYDPDEGAVRVDGADVRSYRLGSLRRQVGFALQGSGVFQGTVLDNLTLGRGFSLPEVEHASRLAGFHEFVTSLPHGYHTVVGEQGVGLSEGQKQRLALARVLLVDAPVLILDEPTSALDPESERAVQEALQLARQGRTTLLVTHRLTAVRQADEIVVLDAGEVVERGDHTALMAKGGVYAALYEATAPTMLGAAQRKETDQCPCARWSTIPRPFGQARLHTGSGALNQERMKQHGQAQQGAPGLLPPTRCVGNGAGLRR